jgi:hypothetical protein
MSFEFLDIWNYDDRSDFANNVCVLLLQSVHNDIDEALKQVKKIHDHFYENVRNVYELINTKIPLFALYELLKHGADNYGLSDVEYEAAKNSCIKAIKDNLMLPLKK